MLSKPIPDYVLFDIVPYDTNYYFGTLHLPFTLLQVSTNIC